MVPIQKAQYRHFCTDEKVMPAAKKFFLAGIFFVIGIFAALIQLHPLNHSAEISESKENTPQEKSGISAVRSPFLSADIAKNGNSGKKIPPFPDTNAPYYDKGTGKYVQAYPQPILLIDEKAVAAVNPPQIKMKQSEQTANQVKKTEPEKPELAKPAQITQADFKPLHQFNTLPNDKPAETAESLLKETPKPVAAGNDELLPVFDFAENLAPAKTKKELEMPVNPFPLIQPMILPIPAAEEKPVQQTAQPQSIENFLFQKLNPLVPADEKEVHKNKPASEIKPSGKPNESPLLRLLPLAGLLQGVHYRYLAYSLIL